MCISKLCARGFRRKLDTSPNQECASNWGRKQRLKEVKGLAQWSQRFPVQVHLTHEHITRLDHAFSSAKPRPPWGCRSILPNTQACDKDPQCGGGMCCAVSIWVKSIRICTPMGKVGDSCHPLTRKNHFGNGRQERRERKRRRRKKEVPFFGRRMHHTCPCLPGLACVRTSFNRFTCLAHK
ncbi:prokineticin-2 isoform X1 [Marmota flaviventris]